MALDAARDLPRVKIRHRGVAMETEKYPRGLCCHEAGHAVVAWSFGVAAVAVYVTFSEARGVARWHRLYRRSALHYMDQATNFAAGRAGEEVFDSPAHYGAWLADLGEIFVLLNENGIPEDQHWVRVTEARECARAVLKTHREKALKLVDRLVERGRVERAEFLRLMNG